MFSRQSPLPVLRQIFLRIVDGHRAVRYSGDHLPQRLGADISRGEHAGEAGAGGFVRLDVLKHTEGQLTCVARSVEQELSFLLRQHICVRPITQTNSACGLPKIHGALPLLFINYGIVQKSQRLEGSGAVALLLLHAAEPDMELRLTPLLGVVPVAQALHDSVQRMRLKGLDDVQSLAHLQHLGSFLQPFKEAALYILEDLSDPDIDPKDFVFHSLRHTSAAAKLTLSPGPSKTAHP